MLANLRGVTRALAGDPVCGLPGRSRLRFDPARRFDAMELAATRWRAVRWLGRRRNKVTLQLATPSREATLSCSQL